MKFIKSLLILSTILLTSISFAQNGDLGKARTLKFTKQVDNKFVEIVFQAQPGDYLGGETYFKFKLEQIIVHQWKIDGKLYTSSNSQGILPANGKLGHVYLDVKIKTINNPFNEFWVKEGFQMNKMTDFQDIDYDGRTENKWWINYAHVSDVNINSVHFSNWFEIEKKLKTLNPNSVSNVDNSQFSNTTVAKNTQNSSSDINAQVQKVAKEMNLREDELKILDVISNTENLNNALAKLNELGYQNFNKYTIDALNKLSTSIPNFPFTGREINTLLNGGSFKDIQKTYNLRQSNKVAQKLGLNGSQTELINIIATSENNEELNQRIKEKNIRDISNLSQNALNKLLGANNTIFPASSSDITAMINGNWEQALTNINNEIQVRNMMNNSNLDRQTAEGINAIGNVISNSIEEKQERERAELKFKTSKQKIKLLNLTTKLNKETNFKGKSNNSFLYNGNFNDGNWTFTNEHDIKSRIIDNNTIELTFINDIDENKKIKDDLLHYMKFTNKDFDMYSDFKISFKIGHYYEEFKSGEKLGKINSTFGASVSFYISNYTNTGSHLAPSFQFVIPDFNEKKIHENYNLPIENEYEYISAYLNDTPGNTLYTVNTVWPDEINGKKIKERNKAGIGTMLKVAKTSKKMFKSYTRLKNLKILFFEYNLIQKNGNLIIENYMPYKDSKIRFYTFPEKIKYMKDDFFAFGIVSMPNVNEKDRKIIIKDFKIEQ